MTKKIFLSILLAFSFISVPLVGQNRPALTVNERVIRYRNELRAFAMDLERMGVERERARRLAYVAVTESYRYNFPPALVLGIMVQESYLKPTAVSVAGAEGLMQIMPKIWKPMLGPYFGYDLFDETTNLRYGIWIAAHFSKRSGGNWVRALDRYSGRARDYPAKVKRHVERHGVSTCPSRNFEQCVTLPLQYVFGAR